MNDKDLTVKFLTNEIKDSICVYQISVTDINSKETWIFKDRYRNLREIHLKISSTFNSDLPIFPPKKWPGNLEASFISQRQKHLENYFNLILTNKKIAEFPTLRDYLFQSKKNFDNNNNNEEKNEKKIEVNLNQFKKKIGNLKIIEELNKRFLDLSLVMNSPDEDEIIRKKKIYRKINFVGKIENKKENLPFGNERNLIHIYQNSFINNETAEIFKLMDNTIFQIMKTSNNSNININFVYNINS